MKNLLSLMEEFSILGMEPAPLTPVPGMEFAPQGDLSAEGEDEYELDAEGNPVLDAQGNPVKKLAPEAGAPAASACGCDHAADSLAPALPAAGGIAPAAGAMVPQLPAELPPEDEFDFTL